MTDEVEDYRSGGTSFDEKACRRGGYHPPAAERCPVCGRMVSAPTGCHFRCCGIALRPSTSSAPPGHLPLGGEGFDGVPAFFDDAAKPFGISSVFQFAELKYTIRSLPLEGKVARRSRDG